MRRFRRKSDSKRSSGSASTTQPSPVKPKSVTRIPDSLPLLPPVDDFRASLILPDLSQRFSVLRQSAGIEIQQVREHLASQRARGEPHAITEEEEEYVINFLAGEVPGNTQINHFPVVDDRTLDDRTSYAISTNYTIPDSEDGHTAFSHYQSGGHNIPHSAFTSTFSESLAKRSSNFTSSASTPPTRSNSASGSFAYGPAGNQTSSRARISHNSYSSHRMSNNLFGSGKFKDQAYIRSAALKSPSSNRSLRSFASRQATEDNGVLLDKTIEETPSSPRAEPSSTLQQETEYANDHFENSIGEAIMPNEDYADEEMQPEEELGQEQIDQGKPYIPFKSQLKSSPVSHNFGSTSASSSQATFPDNDNTGAPSNMPLGSPRIIGFSGPRRGRGTPLFSSAQVHRASLALEEVIRNFEMDIDAEEEILAPRTPPNGNKGFPARGSSIRKSRANPYTFQTSVVTDATTGSPHSEHDEEVTPTNATSESREKDPLRADRVRKENGKRVHGSSPATTPLPPPSTPSTASSSRQPLRHHSRSASTQSTSSVTESRSGAISTRRSAASPIPRSDSRIPGYIPGMHRPITPRDTPEVMSNSMSVVEDMASTPRAMSPFGLSSNGVLTHRRGASGSGASVGTPPRALSGSPVSTSPMARARGQGTHTPTGRGYSTASLYTNLNGSSGHTRVTSPPPIDEDALENNRHTQSSISSSSVQPASTSSSSSFTSTASPHPSPAGSFTNPITSENAHYTTSANTAAHPSSILKPSPNSPSTPSYFDRRKPHVKHPFRPVNTQGNNDTGISGSRPDTPLADMYSGSPGHQSQNSTMSGTALSRAQHDRSASAPTRPSLDEPSSRSQHPRSQSYSTLGHQTRTPPQALQNKIVAYRADSQSLQSPALPDSPLFGDHSGYGAEGDDTDFGYKRSWIEHKRVSELSPLDSPSSVDGGNGHIRRDSESVRSPTPGARSTTPVSSIRHRSQATPQAHRINQHAKSHSSGTFDETGQTITVPPNDSYTAPNLAGFSRFQPITSRAFSPKPIVLHTSTSSSSSSTGMGFTSSSTVAGTNSNPLVLNPLFNSSRSSLVSVGSSFHSLDEDEKSILSLEIDPFKEKESIRIEPAYDNEATESDNEDLLNLLAGLTKNDVAAIQAKLVGSAIQKRSIASVISTQATTGAAQRPTSPISTRSPSQMRKRRPSASQSVRSMNREQEATRPIVSNMISPPPAPTPPKHNSKKADELLKSVVDSLPAPSSPRPNVTIAPTHDVKSETHSKTAQLALLVAESSSGSSGVSPTSLQQRSSPVPSLNDPDLRKKALTEALFGAPSISSLESKEHPFTTSEGYLTLADLEPVKAPMSPKSTLTAEELVQEVQRQNERAMAELKNASTTQLADSAGLKRKNTKKISAHLISGPHLVSSSASVDAVPIGPKSPSQVSLAAPTVSEKDKANPQHSKFSQRFKRLIRSKPAGLNGEEVVHYQYETPSSPSQSTSSKATSNTIDSALLALTATPATAPTEQTRRPNPLPAPASPPPPSQAGFKGLMSRLRKSKRETIDGRTSPVPTSSNTESTTAAVSINSPTTPVPLHTSSMSPSKPQLLPAAVIDHSPQSSPRQNVQDLRYNLNTPPPTGNTEDGLALKQLFAAAENLGLDQNALSELLARSSSTRSVTAGKASKSKPTTSESSPTEASRDNSLDLDVSKVIGGDGLKRTFSARTAGPAAKKNPQHSEPRTSNDDPRVVVRRTLIFPSPEGEGGRKPSVPQKNRRQRASIQSMQSGRSLQERVPTPPPSRVTKRFSKDPTPPMPNSPASFSFSRPEPGFLDANTGRSQKSNSTYANSIFDMYGDSETRERRSSEQNGPSGSGIAAEGTHALEVVELSNGEVIWSVVDAMRSDFAEEEEETSLFQSRLSMTSEYSGRPSREENEGMQVMFKEHRRMSSKTSASSQGHRKRNLGDSNGRPETKVFYSSAAHIARLIESMSQGVDSGSFNISPMGQEGSSTPSRSFGPSSIAGHSKASTHSPATSVSMTDNSIPMEDRLEHMLRKLSPRKFT
ncbi:hypothetical protein FRC02_010819 [Tulasnella sp. 418]|nr:hypothetical protein FRC02_010819 [Tulasnella sp. 418]